jgi:hypothetical protein
VAVLLSSHLLLRSRARSRADRGARKHHVRCASVDRTRRLPSVGRVVRLQPKNVTLFALSLLALGEVGGTRARRNYFQRPRPASADWRAHPRARTNSDGENLAQARARRLVGPHGRPGEDLGGAPDAQHFHGYFSCIQRWVSFRIRCMHWFICVNISHCGRCTRRGICLINR